MDKYIGQKWNRLTCIEFAYKNKFYKKFYVFKCKCGLIKTLQIWDVKLGKVKSCGCYGREQKRKNPNNLKHGHARKTADKSCTRTYKSWQSMKTRCYKTDNIKYKCYGALGVKVCDRWRYSFENFLQDLGERPKGTTLGRYLDLGNYEPGNCKWMTKKEQAEEARKKRELMKGKAA